MTARRRGRSLWPRRLALACTIGGALVWLASTCTSFYGWYPRSGYCLTFGNGHLLFCWGKTEHSSFDRADYLSRQAMAPGSPDARQWGGVKQNSEWYVTWPGFRAIVSGDFWSRNYIGVGWPRLHDEFDFMVRRKNPVLLMPACWFAIVPCPFAIWCYWRTRRYRAGRCQNCGYDLTGNTSGICSECGTPCPDHVAPPTAPHQAAS